MIPEVRHVNLVVGQRDVIAEIAKSGDCELVAIRGICKVIGVSTNNQIEKIKEDPRFTRYDIISTGTDGKKYEMFCLPAEQIIPWLYTINTNKIKNPETKAKLLEFQLHLGKELYAVTMGHISSAKTAALEAQIRILAEEFKAFRAASEDREARALEREEAMMATVRALWAVKKLEASAASYEMHSVKALRKALDNIGY